MSEENHSNSPKPFIPFKFALCVVLVAGGLYFWRHYEIRLDNEKGFVAVKRNLDETNAAPPKNPQQETEKPHAIVPPETVSPMTTFTIATWDLSPLDFEKMSDSTRAQRIADVISQFDLIAVQGLVRTTLPLDELIRRINAKGKNFYYAIPKNLGNMPESVAFLFNMDVVKHDPAKIYEIESSLLTCRPLFATFCTVAPPPEQAFTFNLINVKIPENRKDAESQILGSVFRQIRDGDKDEDDVIILGNFGQPILQIESLRSVPYFSVIHENLPTTIDGVHSTDNIAFDKMRTIEYVGGVECVDLIKRFNLNLDDAKKTSEHLPLAAKFSVFEAGTAGKS